jgi:hypothetical protein
MLCAMPSPLYIRPPTDADRSPRNFGKPASVWTLKLLAEVGHERGSYMAKSRRLVVAPPHAGHCHAPVSVIS